MPTATKPKAARPQRPAPSQKKPSGPEKGAASIAQLNAHAAHDVAVPQEGGRYALPAGMNVIIPEGYRPSAGEEYMNPRQLAYFRRKLLAWRDELTPSAAAAVQSIMQSERASGDEADRAEHATSNALNLATRARNAALISKINAALRRIEDGSFGYCEETDEPIGLGRLEARPVASLSIDAQERREHLQKQVA